MINKRRLALLGVASVAVAACWYMNATVSTAAATNLINNSSFEAGACGAGYCEYAKGSSGIPDWAIGGGSVDIVTRADWPAASGNQSVDLSGSSLGSVSQNVTTVAGQHYTLSWSLAGNPSRQQGCGQPVKVLFVYVGGKLTLARLFDTTDTTFTSMGWTRQSYGFTAISSKTAIKFADGTPGGGACGAALDSVSLQSN